jgi:hypothetical protein
MSSWEWRVQVASLVSVLSVKSTARATPAKCVADSCPITLDLLPPALERALHFTPFPYQLYFPVGIYMGKVTGAELAQGLMIQFGWVIAAYALARFAWHRGIRKYAAVGDGGAAGGF